jgi:microcystin-dependent protein
MADSSLSKSKKNKSLKETGDLPEASNVIAKDAAASTPAYIFELSKTDNSFKEIVQNENAEPASSCVIGIAEEVHSSPENVSVPGLTSINNIPAGAIMMWSMATPPAGWLLCDGTAVSRAAYGALFNVIGYTYGQSSNDFKLPNMAGRFPFGVSEKHALASAGGKETHCLDSTELPNHNHSLMVKEVVIDTAKPSAKSSIKIFIVDNVVKNRLMEPSPISNNGAGLSHNNMPPFMTINFIIKY